MLCKYETASISMTTLESKNVSISKTSSSWTDTTTYTFSASYSKVYAIVSGSAYASQNWEWSVTISLNWTSIWSQSASRPNGSTTVAHTEELTCNAGDIITIDIYVRDWGWSSASFSWTTKISWESSAWWNRLLIAEEIIEIWSQWKATSYWRLQDWSRYWEFYQTVSSSATTGNIALWNCVWFLPIKAKDWTVYKIPIYWA